MAGGAASATPRPDDHRLSLQLSKNGGSMVFLNSGPFVQKLEEAATAVNEASGKDEKTVFRLPTVVGASGQGKTERLMWLLRDELPDGELYSMLKRVFCAKHVVAAFATFNQTSNWLEVEGTTEIPEAAVLSRLMCYCAGKKWKYSMTSGVVRK
jgi:hypothetical protein